MRISFLYFLFFLVGINFSLIAQEEDNNDEKTPTFFGGINVGSYFANSNTAIIYTGGTDITPYGINYILTQPYNKITFDDYFKHPYYLSELPQGPTYKAALDVGFHAGVNVNKLTAIYLDINMSQLKYEQTFTIAIDDPNNQSPEPTYQQIPILGNEKRFNLNLGTQLSFYKQGKTSMYWAIFGNLNGVQVVRNYFVINSREYDIIYNNLQDPSIKPGGIGFGGGTGAGLKYQITSSIQVDFTYNLYFSKTNMTENIQPFGIHHGLMMRILWN